MAIPEIVETLVARFARNRDLYCGSGYKETQLRREFLDPFFEALGWDVDNKRGASPLYQDVVHEYGTDVEGSQKTADYAFRVGEKVKFFAEAKKPGTRLKDDPTPALQLRRYAYSASLPLSILTDFEEFAVYDGRVPPKKADAASHARVLYFTYDEYPERWEEIAAVFSRDAVWRGDFDKYAEKAVGGKHEPVDKAFLKLLERWRDELARNVANRNREKELDKYELSGAVQAILDRVIFLRVAEDRGIEGRSRLEALMTGENVYGRLVELFLEADDVYNSGLFHFREEKGRATARDELTLTLHVDDAVLRKILRELAESPYEFGVVPVEILGQVYEQFLGKTIWLDGRGVHIDYKAEVRKAKGVYYTPQYIVEYIVKNTVGELLKGCKTPTEAAKLKVLDPACGSGSFLLGAYQHLINWHLEWYVNDGPAKHEGRLVATAGPGPASWRLTAAAKKDILLNNIYGVDIDPQAVEVTKLSLLLKALEGESRESVGAQTKFLRERILPDLGDNIKCGNSLIGSDYFEGGQTLMSVPPDEEERRRVNPFDWEVEFEEIMKAGGFDAVIGNPPWGSTFSETELVYFRNAFKTATGKVIDSYAVFIEKGFLVTSHSGFISYITPDTFLQKDDYYVLRDWLTAEATVLDLIEAGPLFRQVRDTWAAVWVIKKDRPTKKHMISRKQISRFIKSVEDRGAEFENADFDTIGNFSQYKWREDPDLILGYLPTGGAQNIIKRMWPYPRLGELGDMYSISRGEEGSKYRLKTHKKGSYFMVIPENVERYSLEPGISVVSNTLTPNKISSVYSKPKIWIIRIQKMRWLQRLVCTLDTRDNSAGMKTLQSIVSNEGDTKRLLYLLGLMNSKLFNYWCVNYLSDDMNQAYLSKLPIAGLDRSNPADVARHDKMVALVEEMLALHKRVAAAKSDADKQRLQRAIDVTDKKIDTLVYELYGLTDEEVEVVEGTQTKV